MLFHEVKKILLRLFEGVNPSPPPQPEIQKRIIGSGPRAVGHSKRYVQPYIGKKLTHTLARDHRGETVGTRVSIMSTETQKGKHFAMVKTKEGKKFKVPHNYLNAPKDAVVRQTAGFDKENEIVNKLKSRGLMRSDAVAAGSKKGHDFHILNKKKSLFGGKEHDTIAGESKISLQAKMGEIALKHTPERGWHVSTRSKVVKPHFAEALERATVNGKPLFDHLNKHWGAPGPRRKLPNVVTDSSDLHPVHAYLKDNNVDIMHIHTHGTYRGGLSENEDRLGIGLPKPTGSGRFNIGVDRGTANAIFRIHQDGFKKSNIDIMNDEHLDKIAKKLGH